MLDKVSSNIKSAMNKLASAIFIDKKIINEVCKELKRALLEADVNTKLINELIEKIKKKAGQKIKGISKKEQIINFIHDELVRILGEAKYELDFEKGKTNYVLMLGLYGSGKTTSISKLAFYYSKRGFKVAALGLDVHRPAAPEQLEQLCTKAKISCFIDKNEKDPIKIWNKYKDELKKFDVVFIDTAGRDAINASLVKEIKEIYRVILPQHMILVMAADIGKTAERQAREFKKAGRISGVFVTRMDGTAKGGGVLVSCNEVNAPVLFMGIGEKLQDIESFSPTSFVSRLLGMGDLEGLLEKAKLAIDEKDKKSMEKNLKEGKFSLMDMYEQIKSMQKMGPLGKITELIPGIGGMKIPEGLLNVQESKMKRWKCAIDSMTKKERENPDLLTSSRIQRISKGSNVPTNEIREMLKQYKLVKSFVGKAKDFDLEKLQKGMASGRGMQGLPVDKKTLRKLAKKFGKGGFKF
jgi:signal recognition particle subunit SRP54